MTQEHPEHPLMQGLDEGPGTRDSAEAAAYRLLMEEASDGIVFLDQEGAFLEFNRKFCEMLGYEVEDLAGRQLSELVPKRDLQSSPFDVDALTAGVNLFADWRMRSRSGNYIDVEVGARLLPDGRVQAIVRDVTERQRMKARVAQADRMASVGTLAAGVAHEINNPLTYVLFNLDVISSELAKIRELPDRLHGVLTGRMGVTEAERLLDQVGMSDLPAELELLAEQAELATGGARRVKKIVSDLRTFARVEDDKRSPVSVNELMDGALSMAHHEMKYRARIKRDYGDIEPVLGNSGRLSQVFLNLLVNAAHAIDDGNVDQNEIGARTWLEGDEVAVEVWDTGHGIRPEHLQRLFDPFFTTRPEGMGAGLGLSVCHNVVSAYGGRIEVDSQAGRGSRFTVWLPAHREHGEAEPDTRPAFLVRRRPAGERRRLLLVDDEPLIRQSIRRILESDFDVIEAESGREAIAVLEREEDFAAVLCDLMMRDLSGMDLYEWIAEHRASLAPHVVLMTGGAFTQRTRAFLDRIDNRCVEKPFDRKQLRQVLDEVLD